MSDRQVNEPRRIRCMFGANPPHDGAGNVADVLWLAGVAPDQLIESARRYLHAQGARPYTSVFVTGSDGRYTVESFARHGMPMRFCGHGALAAAFLVLHDYEPDAESVAFANSAQAWHARRDDSADSNIVLTYSRPAIAVCPVPDFAARCLGSQPVSAAEAGASDDYLILELDNGQSVQALRPDFAAISAATARAIIVTAPEADSPGCVFRYFAPQYGQPEDSATGSAAVQLAAYWGSQFAGESFAARQLSPQGGRMRLRDKGDTVELAARVGYG